MAHLKGQQVIDTPWPAARWEQDPTAERTPLESLEWRYIWPAYPRDGLYRATIEHLEDISTTDDVAECRATIWLRLATAEAEAFYEEQLTQHGFDPEWALDMTYAIQETRSVISIAKWRYCAWAAVRKGASIAVRSGDSRSPHMRNAIYRELLYRADRVANGAWTRCELVPFDTEPESAAGQIFSVSMTNLRRHYWTATPSIDFLTRES